MTLTTERVSHGALMSAVRDHREARLADALDPGYTLSTREERDRARAHAQDKLSDGTRRALDIAIDDEIAERPRPRRPLTPMWSWSRVPSLKSEE